MHKLTAYAIVAGNEMLLIALSADGSFYMSKEHETRSYILSKPAALEDFPFGPDVAVFKINKKMFALFTHNDEHARINLKCDPHQAFILRDIFEAVIPGYHMNKKHWNTVILDGSIPRGEVERMIDHSYSLVVAGLTKKQRLALELQYGIDALYRGNSWSD